MFTHSVQKHCVNEGEKQEVVVSLSYAAVDVGCWGDFYDTLGIY